MDLTTFPTPFVVVFFFALDFAHGLVMCLSVSIQSHIVLTVQYKPDTSRKKK